MCIELQKINSRLFVAICRNFDLRTFEGKLCDQNCGCRKVISFTCTGHFTAFKGQVAAVLHFM